MSGCYLLHYGIASLVKKAIPVQVSDPEINSVQAPRCLIAAQMHATKK